MAASMRTLLFLSCFVGLATCLLEVAVAHPCHIKAGGGSQLSTPQIITTNAVLTNARCVKKECTTSCTPRVDVKRAYNGDIKRTYYCTCHGTQQGDPKFQGFDGSVFWFHGKRETSWCISSDKNLHINAYFNGKSGSDVSDSETSALESPKTDATPHDLTWVQKLAFLFGKHSLIIEAVQESGWDKELDHLNVVLDGQTIVLPPFIRHHDPPAKPWTSPADMPAFNVKLTRVNTRNQMMVEIKGIAAVFIKVVPTNPKTWTSSSSFAHIDAEYTFLRPTSQINGVLGRTLSPVNRRAGGHRDGEAPYVLWNLEDYSTTDITTPDCKVTQFSSQPVDRDDSSEFAGVVKKLAHISCNGEDGRGMACR
eukprot:TRINITY_DN22362_c0_g1_i1.p1 TRINITY_DN22362_c0_g1~~TRINITY_DN22362_c0_g1_i1.p1  ORF type:complete len:366 (+),score=65.84 TRINITY_DN22362_c0_g1_i1:97-1194(+)